MSENKQLRLFLWAGILLYGAYALFAVIFYGAICAESSWNFIRVLETKNFSYADPMRDYTMVVNNSFAILGVYAGITNISVLARLWSLGFATNCLIGWSIALIYSYRIKSLNYLLYTLMLSSLALISSGAFMQIESICALGVFWALYLYFLNYDDASSQYTKYGMIALSMFSTRIHNSFAFFSILLITILVYRIISKQVKIDLFWVITVIMQMVAFVIAAYGIIRPNVPMNAENALRSGLAVSPDRIVLILILLSVYLSAYFIQNNIQNKNWILQGFIIIAALFVVVRHPLYFFDQLFHLRHIAYIGAIIVVGIIANYAFPKFVGQQKIYRQFVIFLQIIGGITVLYYTVTHIDKLGSHITSYHHRTFIILLFFAFACLLFFMTIIKAKYPSGIFRYIVTFFAIASLLTSTVPWVRHNDFLKQLNSFSKQHPGVVVWSETPLSGNQYNNYHFAIASASIIAQAIYGEGEQITGVVTWKPRGIDWEPFDSYNIHDYPDLTRYGVTYDINAFETSNNPDD